MNKKIKDIREFIDKELNLVGDNDEPTTGPNMDTKVGTSTTDKNVRIGHQNYGYDFLGRFGFSLWENDNKNNSLIQELAELIYNKSDSKNGDFSSLSDDDKNKKESISIANEILNIVKKHFKNDLNKNDDKLSESELKKVIEDIVLKKKETPLAKKIDKEVLPKKITDTIDKLSKDDRELVVKYIKDNK